MGLNMLKLSEIGNDILEMQPEIDRIVQTAWPAFLLADETLSYCYNDLLGLFPELQFCLMDGDKIAGIANCILIDSGINDLSALPEEGWSWAISKGIEDRKAARVPDTLAALSITVNPAFQGKGISHVIVGMIKDLAASHSVGRVIVPLRPTMKSLYPLHPFEHYINWKRADGQYFDPWIRTHVKEGAVLVKPCSRSMFIKGEINDWEKWTGMHFFENGDYIIPGAFSPVHMDLDRNSGEYSEANLWVAYT